MKFLVHFVGDIHQPMHAVKEAAGGNGIHLSFLSSKACGPYECNLHGVWDTSMLLRTGLNRDQYSEHEQELIKAHKLEAQAGEAAERDHWEDDAEGFRFLAPRSPHFSNHGQPTGFAPCRCDCPCGFD